MLNSYMFLRGSIHSGHLWESRHDVSPITVSFRNLMGVSYTEESFRGLHGKKSSV